MSKKIKSSIIIALLLLVPLLIYATYTKIKTGTKKEVVPDKTPVVAIPANSQLGDEIVNYGMEFLGTPYVEAACSKDGFDCSGFVYFVFKHFKINVPRSSAQFEHFGKEIPIADVQKGDVLLFLSPTRNAIGHIGIVSNADGNKSDFIHASSGSEMKVIISTLKKDGYAKRFVKAVRVL